MNRCVAQWPLTSFIWSGHLFAHEIEHARGVFFAADEEVWETGVVLVADERAAVDPRTMQPVGEDDGDGGQLSHSYRPPECR